MIVYPDTSFLVSYLNEDDTNHKPARDQAAKFKTDDFVVCELQLWHLAAAWSLSAGAFLTFDERQSEIAKLLGMTV